MRNDKNLIYNLEFPEYIHELNIAGYKFTRIPDYAKAYMGLQHLVTFHGREFPTKLQTGSHHITATVEYPNIEKPNVLPWENQHTLIHDILLLLTIFTGRSVFRNEWGNQEVAIQQDSRRYYAGGELSLAIQEPMLKNQETGEIVPVGSVPRSNIFEYNHIDIGLEKNINRIIELISTEAWREKYDRGYFLFIFRQAAQQFVVDSAFILCWSIWEHIVTLHHKRWLSDSSIRKFDSYEKISFVLSEYFLKKIDNKAIEQIKKLAKIRNRLMHYGRIPEKTDIKEMNLFIRLTEQLIAMTLGLKPSDILNSADNLQKFLDGDKVEIFTGFD